MNNELELLQDEAYQHLLEKLGGANDPDDIQKIANALCSMDKGRNERDKITSDYVLSESKANKESELAERKLAEEREDRLKQMKFERHKGRWDIGLKLGALGIGGVLGFLAYKEEDEGYPLHPNTVRNAKEFVGKLFKF